jgi:hypothetical protein
MVGPLTRVKGLDLAKTTKKDGKYVFLLDPALNWNLMPDHSFE